MKVTRTYNREKNKCETVRFQSLLTRNKKRKEISNLKKMLWHWYKCAQQRTSIQCSIAAPLYKSRRTTSRKNNKITRRQTILKGRKCIKEQLTSFLSSESESTVRSMTMVADATGTQLRSSSNFIGKKTTTRMTRL